MLQLNQQFKQELDVEFISSTISYLVSALGEEHLINLIKQPNHRFEFKLGQILVIVNKPEIKLKVIGFTNDIMHLKDINDGTEISIYKYNHFLKLIVE